MPILNFRLFDPPMFPRIEWKKYLGRADVPTIMESWTIQKAGNIVDGSMVRTTVRTATENALKKVRK